MALKKEVICDRVEVLERGQVQVRMATVITDGGAEVSRTFQRHVLEPGADTTNETERVRRIADATGTPQVVSDWNDFLAAR